MRFIMRLCCKAKLDAKFYLCILLCAVIGLATGCAVPIVPPDKLSIDQAKSIGYYINKNEPKFAADLISKTFFSDNVNSAMSNMSYYDTFKSKSQIVLNQRLHGRITLIEKLDGMDIDENAKLHGFDVILKTTVQLSMANVPDQNIGRSKCIIYLVANTNMTRVADHKTLWSQPVRVQYEDFALSCKQMCESTDCVSIFDELAEKAVNVLDHGI